MFRNKLSEWASRLDFRQGGDVELDLALTLQANRPPAPVASSEFMGGLRDALAQRAVRQQHYPKLKFGWLGAALGLSLVVLVIILAVHMLPDPPTWNSVNQPGAMQLPSSTPLPAVLPEPTSTQVISPTQSLSPTLQSFMAAGPARLAFSCAPGIICTANPDGSQVSTLLTLPEQSITLLSVSSDRRYLLLTTQPDFPLQTGLDATPDVPGLGRHGVLYVYNLVGGDLVQLSDHYAGDTPTGWITAAWLSDGRVVFIAEDEQLQTAIYCINPDGSGRTRLTTLAPSPSHWQLLPSPNLERVYWRSGEVQEYGVGMGKYWWASLSGEQTQTQAWSNLDTGGLGEVRFSPDGEKIAYTQYGGQLALYIANLDGSEPLKVWAAPPSETTPGLPPQFYWSPTGGALLLEQYLMDSATETASVVYAMYDVQSGLTTKLDESLNVQEDVSKTGSWQIGFVPQWSLDGRSVLLNHPGYSYPKLLDLDTLTVTDVLTLALPPGDLIWQAVLWLP